MVKFYYSLISKSVFMKKLFLISFILFIILQAKSQNNDDNLFTICEIQQKYFEEQAQILNVPIKEVPGYKDFHNWKKFFKTRVGGDGSIGAFYEAMDSYYEENTDVISDLTLSWNYIGPEGLWPLVNNHNLIDNNVGQGLIISVWTDPNNSQHILAGGHWSGGLWKTDDGGDTWRNITEGERKIQAVSSIWVNQNIPNDIYITTFSDPFAYTY